MIEEPVPGPKPLRFAQLPPDKQAAIKANLAKIQAAGLGDDQIMAYLREGEHLADFAPPAGLHLTSAVGTPPPAAAAPESQDPVQRLLDQTRAQNAARIRTIPSAGADVSSGLPRNRAGPTGDWEATKGSLATNYLNALQTIPGMGAAQAYIGSKMTGMPYSAFQAGLQGEINKIPAPIRIGEQLVTGAAIGKLPGVGAMLPANPVKAGAIYGGASQALAPEPFDASASGIAGRLGRTALGAATGAAAGKVGSLLTTGAQTVGQPTTASMKIAMMADRAQSADRLYTLAQEQGLEHEVTPQLQAFLAEPDMAPRVARITSGRTGSQMEMPEVLHRLHQDLAAEQQAAKQALTMGDPVNPSGVHSRMEDAAAAKAKLVDLMSSPGHKPPLTLDVAPETYSVEPTISPEREPMMGPISDKPLTTSPNRPFATAGYSTMHGPPGPAFALRGDPGHITPGVDIQTPGMRVQTAPGQDVPAYMPAYKAAKDDFARRSREIEALGIGYDAVTSPGLPKKAVPFENLDQPTATPEGFNQWLSNPKTTPAERDLARQGVLTGARSTFQLGGKTLAPARQGLSTAAEYLRQFPGAAASAPAQLERAGIVGANEGVNAGLSAAGKAVQGFDPRAQLRDFLQSLQATPPQSPDQQVPFTQPQ